MKDSIREFIVQRIVWLTKMHRPPWDSAKNPDPVGSGFICFGSGSRQKFKKIIVKTLLLFCFNYTGKYSGVPILKQLVFMFFFYIIWHFLTFLNYLRQDLRIRNFFLDPELVKRRSWIRIQNKSLQIHNTAMGNEFLDLSDPDPTLGRSSESGCTALA